jgi:hypothetical protein
MNNFNKDRLYAEIEDLKDRIARLDNQQCDLVYALLSIEHKKGGSLGLDGQFYYKVPESVFKKAEKLVPATSLAPLINKTEDWDAFGIGGER